MVLFRCVDSVCHHVHARVSSSTKMAGRTVLMIPVAKCYQVAYQVANDKTYVSSIPTIALCAVINGLLSFCLFVCFYLLGRILAACYWFCILVWVSTYTANLAAFFTVKNAAAPINNLEDILTSSYKVTIVEYGSTYEFFQTSQYETHRKIWYRIQAHNSFGANTSEAVKLVRGKDDYVFIYDGPVVRHLANNPPCDLITGKDYFSRFITLG